MGLYIQPFQSQIDRGHVCLVGGMGIELKGFRLQPSHFSRQLTYEKAWCAVTVNPLTEASCHSRYVPMETSTDQQKRD